MAEFQTHDRIAGSETAYLEDGGLPFGTDLGSDEAAIQAGLADIAAGRTIPNEEVAAWLATWGTPEEKPAPSHWFE